MKVKFKKLYSGAKAPLYAKYGDAGLDLTAFSRTWDEEYDVWNYGTGIAIEIPEGYVGLVFPRSSIYKKEQILSNSVGVIDSGYRGEICFKFRDTKETNYIYELGEKIGQILIIPYPQIELEQVQELSELERVTDGFGSSGK
jgi:dUTP pyrophosphatase